MLNPLAAPTKTVLIGATGLALLLSATVNCLATDGNTPSALEEDSAGWTDIMPTSGLAGWSRVPVPPNAPLGKQQWSVQQGGKVLVCEGNGGHDMLLCEREFGDAIFHL